MELSRRKANIPVTESAKSKFKLEKLPQYSEVYMMPMAPAAAAYREALHNYTREDYEADETRFRRMHPDVGRCVMCRYPNLAQMRKYYCAGESIVIAGPSDPMMVDMLSRCMRNRLLRYYDIDTGEAVPYRRYNAYGYPLIGNTEQIDHGARLKIDTKFKPKRIESHRRNVALYLSQKHSVFLKSKMPKEGYLRFSMELKEFFD